MTPKEWIESSAQLICLKCGQPIALDGTRYSWAQVWCHRDFDHAEGLAARAQAIKIHTCAVSVELAREAMKRYRAENPPMTFEEEVELYKRLINP